MSGGSQEGLKNKIDEEDRKNKRGRQDTSTVNLFDLPRPSNQPHHQPGTSKTLLILVNMETTLSNPRIEALCTVCMGCLRNQWKREWTK